jgi:hypothetical protein
VSGRQWGTGRQCDRAAVCVMTTVGDRATVRQGCSVCHDGSGRRGDRAAVCVMTAVGDRAAVRNLLAGH